MLERALRSACLAPRRGPRGEYRVAAAWPGQVHLAWHDLELRAAPMGSAEGPVRYPLPLETCRQWVARGIDDTELVLVGESLDDLPARVRAEAERLAAA